MTVTYNLEPADFRARDRFTVTRGHGKQRYGTPIAVALLLIVGAVLYGASRGMSSESAMHLLLSEGLPLLGAVVVGIVFVTLRRTHYYARQMPPEAYALTTVTLTPEALVTADSFGQVLLKWSTIKGIGQDDRCIYLWVLEHSDEMQIVPKRAFSTPADVDAFFDLAQTYVKAAKAD